MSERKRIPRDRAQRRTGLARGLSKLGYCSRSAASRLVRAGKVRVNGRVIRDPEFPIALPKDRIALENQQLKAATKTYLMMNKPRGLVTSARDEKNRETVYSLLPEYRQWLAPVGRLDKASEGLLLFTNDSPWGARITAPESHLEKTYHVQIRATCDEALLRQITAGIEVEREVLKAKRASIVRHGAKNCWLEIVLEEGKNRHIRRMLAALGTEVLRVVRIGIGPLRLGDLPKGTVRELTRQEKSALDRAITS